jgi:hypothetical protein
VNVAPGGKQSAYGDLADDVVHEAAGSAHAGRCYSRFDGYDSLLPMIRSRLAKFLGCERYLRPAFEAPRV